MFADQILASPSVGNLGFYRIPNMLSVRFDIRLWPTIATLEIVVKFCSKIFKPGGVGRCLCQDHNECGHRCPAKIRGPKADHVPFLPVQNRIA